MKTLEYLNESELKEYHSILEQNDLERVSPKLEKFRNKYRIKIAYGGRGAGAKSWGIASLLVQRANIEKLRILCTREIQQSLEESVHHLICQTIERLNYNNWYITKDHIESPAGARFAFKGLKDLRAANQIKGYEDYDIFWVEEAATVSDDSWDALIPTLRKPGSELWISFNRNEELDPVYLRFISHKRNDCLVVWLEPGKKDNPWWTKELQNEMEEDYKRDPDLAEHIWGGQPKKQGEYAVLSRVSIKGAMERNIEPEGSIEIGVDVARFGDDKTVIYKRHGFKVIDYKEFKGQDTQRTAKEAWLMADSNPETIIKVDDTGVGSGVTDRLNELGARVIPINFGEKPKDKDKYTSVADEMWFEFPVNEADIPNGNYLMQELSGRRYDFDKAGRRKIESKKDFKKRIGRSPDHADALLLCFYEGNRILKMSEFDAADLGL